MRVIFGNLATIRNLKPAEAGYSHDQLMPGNVGNAGDNNALRLPKVAGFRALEGYFVSPGAYGLDNPEIWFDKRATNGFLHIPGV